MIAERLDSQAGYEGCKKTAVMLAEHCMMMGFEMTLTTFSLE